MPIYEYQCQSCRHQFEAMRKISDGALTKCPECGKRKLKKLVSAVAFRLKGGGWYETDFKSGGKKNVAGDTSKADDKPSDTDKTKSEKTASSGDTAQKNTGQKDAAPNKESKTESKAKSETKSKDSKPRRSKDD